MNSHISNNLNHGDFSVQNNNPSSSESWLSTDSANMAEVRLEFFRLLKNLKQELNLTKKYRKLEFDSLLKRVKIRFFRCFHNCIKSCILEDNLVVNPLPQKFITDIRIPINKKIINMTLEEIYAMNDVNLDYLFFEENKHKLAQDKFLIFSQLWKMPFSKAYEIYLESHQYEKDLIVLSNIEEFSFIKLFKFTSKNFILYYKINKGHNMTKKSTKKVKSDLYFSANKYSERCAN